MKEMDKKKALFIPSVQKGNGTGHFRRCLSFSNSDALEGKLFVPDTGNENEYSIFELKASIPGFTRSMTVQRIEDDWDLIILDQRDTPRELMDALPADTPVIAVDEGSADDRMDYLIDMLPAPGKPKANLFQPLLGIDPHIPVKQSSDEASRRILITFGGEDRAGLTSEVLDYFLGSNTLNDMDLTVVEGPMFTEKIDVPGIRVLHNPVNLSSLISGYDLVITSFGVTSYEAVRAGVPVIHVNPSSYHTRLSRHAGFQVAGTKGVQKRYMDTILAAVVNKTLKGPWEERESCNYYFPEYIAGLELKKTDCPCCHSRERKSLERFPERSFYKCRSCGAVYQSRAVDHTIRYDAEYFFEDYQKQYGKTYLEDFKHIEETGSARIRRMKKAAGNKEGGDLLDIGCAYGPFLSAAEAENVLPAGIDISEEAVEYVTGDLNLEAYCCRFPEEYPRELRDRKFDFISMWYVIEHFGDIEAVVRKVSSLCPKGGVFGFSTPNGSGISFRRNRRQFLSKSPQDHTVILTPRSAGNLLREHGFTPVKTVATGIHRERMPGWISWLPEPLLKFAARLWMLGDTFEIYAVKE